MAAICINKVVNWQMRGELLKMLYLKLKLVSESMYQVR